MGPITALENPDAGANAVELVVGAHDDAGRHLGMLAVGAGMGAILKVAGDVEDRAEFLLQPERLAHELFRPRIVVNRRQDGECLFAGKKDCFGMAHVFARQKRKRKLQ